MFFLIYKNIFSLNIIALGIYWTPSKERLQPPHGNLTHCGVFRSCRFHRSLPIFFSLGVLFLFYNLYNYSDITETYLYIIIKLFSVLSQSNARKSIRSPSLINHVDFLQFVDLSLLLQLNGQLALVIHLALLMKEHLNLLLNDILRLPLLSLLLLLSYQICSHLKLQQYVRICLDDLSSCIP